MTSAKAGACPKCGSTNTEIILLRGPKTDEPGTYKDYGYTTVAYGLCHHCGFEDMRLRGADYEMVLEQARRSFSTVYVNEDEAVDGLPIVSEIAHDISVLMREMCILALSCEGCPLHSSHMDTPEEVSDEGYFAENSRMGLSCAAQDFSHALRQLRKMYPALPID